MIPKLELMLPPSSIDGAKGMTRTISLAGTFVISPTILRSSRRKREFATTNTNTQLYAVVVPQTPAPSPKQCSTKLLHYQTHISHSHLTDEPLTNPRSPCLMITTDTPCRSSRSFADRPESLCERRTDPVVPRQTWFFWKIPFGSELPAGKEVR